MLDRIFLDHVAENQQLLIIPTVASVIMLFIAITATVFVFNRLDITHPLLLRLEPAIIVNYGLQTGLALFRGKAYTIRPFAQFDCTLERFIHFGRNVIEQGFQVREVRHGLNKARSVSSEPFILTEQLSFPTICYHICQGLIMRSSLFQLAPPLLLPLMLFPLVLVASCANHSSSSAQDRLTDTSRQQQAAADDLGREYQSCIKSINAKTAVENYADKHTRRDVVLESCREESTRFTIVQEQAYDNACLATGKNSSACDNEAVSKTKRDADKMQQEASERIDRTTAARRSYRQ